MDTNQKVTYGILGFLTLVIAAFGGSQYLTQDQVDHAYVCSINENVGFFERMSSTMKTGYWIDEQGIEKSKVCTNGIWIKLKDYAESKGVSIESLLQQKNEEEIASGQTGGKQYLCDREKCVRIE